MRVETAGGWNIGKSICERSCQWSPTHLDEISHYSMQRGPPWRGGERLLKVNHGQATEIDGILSVVAGNLR
jgi:hypothetical protein